MASNFNDLDDRLRIVAGQLEINIESLMADIIASIGIAVVLLTPVKTGFARANWRPSLNIPAPTPLTFLDPTGSTTIARIESIALSWRLGDQAFITNNVDYIADLNAGSSPQRAAGFVQLAIQEGIREVLQSGIVSRGLLN